MMIQNEPSASLQARKDRLQRNADQLFALGNVREHCQAAIKVFHEDMQPSPFATWGAVLRENREYRFAMSLTLTYTSTKDEIIQLVKGCQEEYLLQEMEEERERQIEDFARMKIASRWYQMKNDDLAWRMFSQNIPYGDKNREEEIRKFFETLDRICILTDTLMGHAAEYGLNVDYEHMAELSEAPIEVQKGLRNDDVVDAIHELTDVVKEKWNEPRIQNIYGDKNNFQGGAQLLNIAIPQDVDPAEIAVHIAEQQQAQLEQKNNSKKDE